MDGQFLLNGLLYSGFPVEGECLKKAAHMAKESTCVMYKAQFIEYVNTTYLLWHKCPKTASSG
jgi:hypothetical protein